MAPVISARASSDIDLPPAEVFAFLADATNNPRWQRGMRSCTWTTDPPITVGSSYDQIARFLGKDVVTHFEVVELEPPHRVTIRSRPGSSFPLTVTRTVEALGERRCRATEVVNGDPRGFYRIFTPLLAAMVRRSMRADHHRLAELLNDTGAAETPG
ncbi:MAG TPA: SRPBCC family protein [Acidimicrobiia bacterium]